MRKFVTWCTDNKTGYTMILSDANYNHAMYWLQVEAQKSGKEIFRTNRISDGDVVVEVGTPVDSTDVSGRPERFFTDIIYFHYDEERGYLMRE